MYDELIASLNIVGFEEHERDTLFNVLGAILHLSNIEFVEDDSKATVQGGAKGLEALRLTAKYLGVDEDGLVASLTTNVRHLRSRYFAVRSHIFCFIR